MNKFFIVILASMIFLAATYSVNLVRFVNCDFEQPYKAEVVYGSGLVLPSFVVTAFMDLGK